MGRLRTPDAAFPDADAAMSVRQSSVEADALEEAEDN